MTPRRAAAALLAIVLTVLMLSASPAHAAGWSGKRCFTETGSGFKVCTQVYASDNGANYRVLQTQVCTDGFPSDVYGVDKFVGSKNADVQFRGANGVSKGYDQLADTARDACTITRHVEFTMGGGACYTASGTANLSGGLPDRSWTTRGSILGGPC